MRFIDGKAIATRVREEVSDLVATLATTPTLAVVVPTDDEATDWYVRTIRRTAEKVGVRCAVLKPADVTAELELLSAQPGVHAIICQTPLPEGVTLADVGVHIAVEKDVDGANPASLGAMAESAMRSGRSCSSR